MFARVLVPLDGSPRAERAIPLAATIATANHGTVILVRVATMPIEYGPAWIPPLSVDTTEAERTEFTGYLSGIAALPALVNVSTEIAVLEGPPARTILEASSTKQADLVVMTSHGRTGFSQWMLGSVAQQIAQHAAIPVLVLREQGAMLASQHPDVEHLPRLLVPLDGSQLAEAALEPAAVLADALSPTPALHLVLVVSPYDAIQEHMPEALVVQGAKDYLSGAADQLKQSYPALAVTWSVGIGLDIAETIIRIAERGDDTEGAGIFGGCDVIAIATHGRTGFSRWALGSVTDRVLHGTKLPLLIVRPPKMAAAAAQAAMTRATPAEQVEVSAAGARQSRPDEADTSGTENEEATDIPAWSALL